MLGRVLTGIALIAALSSATAYADQAGGGDSMERVVSLVDGAIYRGEVIELVPGGHVVLRLMTGEVKRFPWKQIRKVSTVSQSVPSAPAARRDSRPPRSLPPPPTLAATPAEPAARPGLAPGPMQAAEAAESVPPAPPPGGWSPSPEALESFQRHLDRAHDLFQSEDYGAALEEYRAAYADNAHPKVLYNIGKTEQKLGEFAKAYESYRQYLAESRSLDEERRAQVERRMEGLLQRQRALAEVPPEMKSRVGELAFVSIQSDRNDLKLQLFKDSRSPDTGGTWVDIETWRTLCKPPCDRLLSNRGLYRIDGPEISSSAKFSLPARSRDIMLKVRPGSYGMRVAAWTLLFVGLGVNLTGLSIALSALESSEMSAMPGSGSDLTKNVGIGMGVSGVALMLVSIPLFVGSKTAVIAQ